MEKLKISLIGPTGAGKSTFLRWAIHTIQAQADRLGYGIAWRANPFLSLRPDEEAPSTTTPQSAQGTLDLFGREYELDATDTPGESLDQVAPVPPPGVAPPVAGARPESIPLARAIAGSDLLILVIDPDTVVRHEVREQAITNLTTAVRSVTPRPAVVIAYTKADEYGVLGTLRQRFIETADQRAALLRWYRGVRDGIDADKRWARLVDAACPPDEPGSPTRRRLLLDTGRLWRELIGAQIDANRLNAYFVTARAADPHARPDEVDRLGLVDIISDFVRETAVTRNRPRFRPAWSAAAFLAGLLFLAAVLLWPHLGWWTMPAVAGAGGAAGAGGWRAVTGRWGGWGDAFRAS